jgi:FtsP/CotA-like multicopper oxidase with cupredoxin domain
MTYTAGTGVPGPGFFSGGTLGLTQTNTGSNQPTYETYGCKVANVDPIQTPDWQIAKVYFERKVFTDGAWTFADGKVVPHWGFEDLIKAKGAKPYPSPTIRLREGDLAHVKMETRHGAHTIHHHGIEPTTMNDGVGHVSFETSGNYVYQWIPRHAGTFFYHCHVNTVLHFEMGLFGLLVVDPPEGWGYPFKGAKDLGLTYKYDVEAFWVADDVDARWHSLDKSAGLCGEDAGLNIFKPRYFLLSGQKKPLDGVFTGAPVAVRATKGKKILVRLLNASYSILGVTINGLDADIISVDGHSLVSTSSNPKPWSGPKRVAAGTEMRLASAMRHDLLIDTSNYAPGTYEVSFKHYDWVTQNVHNAGQGFYEGSYKSSITVT